MTTIEYPLIIRNQPPREAHRVMHGWRLGEIHYCPEARKIIEDIIRKQNEQPPKPF